MGINERYIEGRYGGERERGDRGRRDSERGREGDSWEREREGGRGRE